MNAGLSTISEADSDSQPWHHENGGAASPTPKDSRLRRFLEYWWGIRGDRRIPLRVALDPAELTWGMPNIWLMKYDAATDVFRYRLAGERIQAMFGKPVADRTLADLLPAEVARVYNVKFARLRAMPALCYDLGELYQDRERRAVGERLLCPLSDNGESVDYVIGMTVYELELIREPALIRRPDEHPKYESVFLSL